MRAFVSPLVRSLCVASLATASALSATTPNADGQAKPKLSRPGRLV